jgi:acetylornithine deacetylase/succinyl-diaminopimelate desuccinylase-like protein
VPALRKEATELLQRLLRLDTVNPPGNETAAAELLRAYLEPLGVECELYARVPERANLVARIRGSGSGPTLMLLAHTDTVVADASEWSVDPWSGALRKGEIWGRGALDMKHQVAASAVAIAVLAREGFAPAGDLIFAAVADEEVGDGYGLSWLCEEHPDAVRAEYCVNEGGGDRTVLNGRSLYFCATAERMSSPFRLRVHGRSGHASMPNIADNPVVSAGRLIARLADKEDKPRLLPETEAFLEAVLGRVPAPEAAAERVGAVDPGLEVMIEPMLAFSVCPTMIEGSNRRNVIPGVCDVVCDCRLLPGQKQSEVEGVLREWLGRGNYEITWLEGTGGTRSPVDTVLWPAIEAFVRAEEPESQLVPVILSGFTDSHYMRKAFATVAYGFFPMRAMDAELASRLIHSANERIPVDDLELGTRFLLDVARRMCSAPPGRGSTLEA